MSGVALNSLVAAGLALSACSSADRGIDPDEKLELVIKRIQASDAAMLFVEGDSQTLENVERYAFEHGWKVKREDGKASISFGTARTKPEVSLFLSQLFQNQFGPVQHSSVVVMELPTNSALQKNK